MFALVLEGFKLGLLYALIGAVIVLSHLDDARLSRIRRGFRSLVAKPLSRAGLSA